MTGATEDLRARLDELGVEHYDHEDGEPLRDLSEAGADPATSWRMGGASVCAVPNKHGTFDLWIDNCTPKQAIAMTAGAGTCHMEVHDNLAETEGMGDVWLECDKCHWQMQLEPTTPKFRYCPNCRAKAVAK